MTDSTDLRSERFERSGRTLSRRAVLKLGGAGLAATLSGCSSSNFSNGEESMRTSFPSWLYSPRAVGTSHGAFFYLAEGTIRGYEDALSEFTYQKYRGYVNFPILDAVDADGERIDELLLIYPQDGSSVQGGVLEAKSGWDAVRPRLSRSFDRQGQYRNAEFYWSSSEFDAAVGIDGRRLLLGFPTAQRDPREILEALIDAKSGTARRYRESNDDLDLLLEAVGTGDDVSGFTYPRQTETDARRAVFEGAVGRSHRYRFGDEWTESRYVFVFDRTENARAEAVESWISKNADGRLFEAYESVSVSTDGRAVIANGTLPTADV